MTVQYQRELKFWKIYYVSQWVSVGAPRGSYRERCLHSQSSHSKGDARGDCNPEQCRAGAEAPEMRDTEFWGRNSLRMNYTAPATLEEHLPDLLGLKKDQPLLCPSLAQL